MGFDSKQWERLDRVLPCHLESGDVLIKHVFFRKTLGDVTEKLIRVGAAVHVFDTKGSGSAEHAAMVGTVFTSGQVGVQRIFEADNRGLVVNTVKQTNDLCNSNSYTVFRCTGNTVLRDCMSWLCDGMATRLAVIQNEGPGPIWRGGRTDLFVYLEACTSAHIKRQTIPASHPVSGKKLNPKTEKLEGIGTQNFGQTTRYGYGNMATMVLPNILPDSLWSKWDEKVVNFIAGTHEGLALICSGLVASMLQAWNVGIFSKRIFNDPANVHPTGIEHHLLSGHMYGWERIGRLGTIEHHG